MTISPCLINGYNIIEVINVLLPEFPVMKILLFRLKTNIPLGTVKQYLKPNCSVIDFGSGDGVRINNITADITSNLCLVENSDNMLAKIKEQYPHVLTLNQDFSDTHFETKNKYI